ncbi:MAG: peptidylprolyl isomerase [Sedimentisphaerales bacterium]
MRLFSSRSALSFLGFLVVLCNCYAAGGQGQQKILTAEGAKHAEKELKLNSAASANSAVKQAAEPSDIVAKIGDYVITKEELEKRLMSEFRPDDQYSETVQPVDAREVLMKMIAEKAMVIEARQQGKLADEQIQVSIKRFKERMLINLCLGRYFKGKQDEMAVTDAEIDEKLKRDPKLDRKRAIALLQREKTNRLFDQYYNQLCKKFHVRKESQNFPKAAKIHQRLLHHPKNPRKQWWILGSQIRDELTQQEKDIVLATYDNGKITLKDWFDALDGIAPPSRPRDLNTPQGVQRLLERPLRVAVLVAEAKSLGLDKDENFIKQIRQREDRMLLNKAVMEKTKAIKEPTDQQIVAYFEKNKQVFATPKMLKIDQIWCQDLKTAGKAKAELEKGKDFEAVKQECSLQKESRVFHTDPGSEGIFFEDLWKADPNEVVGPVKGFYGDGLKWRIVKILEKKPAVLKEYSDNMKSRVRARMLDEQRKAILEKYRKELLQKYSYEIYAERIKDIDPLEIP